MFQLVQDSIKEGQEAFFLSWKNEGTWKPFQMVSIRAAASLYRDPVNYEKEPQWAEAILGHTAWAKMGEFEKMVPFSLS